MLGPAVDGGRPVAAAEDATDGDDGDIAQKVLRLRVCRGSSSDSKYEPREPSSTSLAMGSILSSVGVGRRMPNWGRRRPEPDDWIQDIEPRFIASDYPDRSAIRAGRASGGGYPSRVLGT